MYKHLIVLLVEDDQDVQDLMGMKLKDLGLTYTSVSDGYQCIEALYDNRYDLILMDLEMPKLNGVETTKRIVEACGQDRPMIVAVTGNTGDGVWQACLKAGMDSYLPKPLKKKDLEKILQNLKQSQVAS